MRPQQSNSVESTAKVPLEIAQALFTLINRVRKLNGWMLRDLEELKPQISTWFETFYRHQIPITAYQELFNRSFDVRARQLSRGEDPSPMDATLLVSQWIGEDGLQKELRRREQGLGRTLSANAGSVCKWCLGSGWRSGNVDDPKAGVVRCDHSDPQAKIEFEE